MTYRLRLFIAFAARTKLLNFAILPIISSSIPESLGNWLGGTVAPVRIQGSI